jgi:hypothetical protein
MIKTNCHIIVLMLFTIMCLLNGCSAQQKDQLYSYTHPIPYNPETYVCHRVSEELVIDGRDNEAGWKSATWSNPFVDIEGSLKPKPRLNTKVKMLWDSSYFYFFAKLEEPHIWATLKNRDDIIFFDDDFEIFIDPDGDGHNYYELEWNAYNTLWDLILLRPYRVDKKPKVLFEWNITDIKSATHIDGTINDNSDTDRYWSIEIAIPWSTLREFAFKKDIPSNGDQWRVNFSRVDWTMQKEGTSYQKRKYKEGNTIPENNWVWSPTGEINMHMPEMWGYVQFSDNDPTQKDGFNENPDEKIKWGLWNLYWQQLDYYKKNNSYTNDMKVFDIPKVEGCQFNPIIYTTPFHFEITNLSCKGEGVWIIQSDGRIYLKKTPTQN